MERGSRIQHWLVTVARSAGLEGAEELAFESHAGTEGAWQVVAMALGVSEDDLARKVADHFRLEVADLHDADPHATRLVPRSVAERFGVVPLAYTDRTIVVATDDPLRMDAEKEIRHLTARAPVFRVAPPDPIREAIEALYPRPDDEEHRVPALMTDEIESPHILVVDDDPDIRHLLRTALQSKDFRVSEADGGPRALEILGGNEAVHLVTLDLMMDEMSGLEVLKRIRGRARSAGIPVVIATAADDPDVEIELFEAGADDFVVKPLDPNRFILRIQAVLRRYRSGGMTLGA